MPAESSPSWANCFFPGLVSCFHCQLLELTRYPEHSCAVSHPVIKPKTVLCLESDCTSVGLLAINNFSD
ncbi:hypothetical protein AV530_001020 [Patagioenas fasciata monilis]|uniref:Uncharacterized protein n=1 Tax=Patagioenas fasciata monilis TaxID=372326 RepID=A0A1V4KT10_PATFA|nr:hypothetical protein AV530_001020 [Patagioenas fasciata monilis]